MAFCSRTSSVGGVSQAGGAATGAGASGTGGTASTGGAGGTGSGDGTGVHATAGQGNGTQFQAGDGAWEASGVMGASGGSSARAALPRQRNTTSSAMNGERPGAASPPRSITAAGFFIGVLFNICSRGWMI